MLDMAKIKSDVRIALRDFSRHDLRWSHLAIGVMILIGVIVNLLLPHGWTVWPFVLAAGIITMVHEAAERNGQGVPPLHAYAFFAGAVIMWVVLVSIFAAVNPFILVAGVFGLGYHSTQGYLKGRQRMKLIAQRRADGQCIHCGEPANKVLAYCENCGEEPDPVATQLQRVASTIHQNKKTAHARSVLTPESNATKTSRREKAILRQKGRR